MLTAEISGLVFLENRANCVTAFSYAFRVPVEMWLTSSFPKVDSSSIV